MRLFYHSEKLQSTKTGFGDRVIDSLFYHSEKLQSTKTQSKVSSKKLVFYHSEKLQSTKTKLIVYHCTIVNDTLRMYKNDDIRMYNFDCITDTIVEVITTCNMYTLLTVHLL